MRTDRSPRSPSATPPAGVAGEGRRSRAPSASPSRSSVGHGQPPLGGVRGRGARASRRCRAGTRGRRRSRRRAGRRSSGAPRRHAGGTAARRGPRPSRSASSAALPRRPVAMATRSAASSPGRPSSPVGAPSAPASAPRAGARARRRWCDRQALTTERCRYGRGSRTPPSGGAGGRRRLGPGPRPSAASRRAPGPGAPSPGTTPGRSGRRRLGAGGRVGPGRRRAERPAAVGSAAAGPGCRIGCALGSRRCPADSGPAIVARPPAIGIHDARRVPNLAPLGARISERGGRRSRMCRGRSMVTRVPPLLCMTMEPPSWLVTRSRTIESPRLVVWSMSKPSGSPHPSSRTCTVR